MKLKPIVTNDTLKDRVYDRLRAAIVEMNIYDEDADLRLDDELMVSVAVLKAGRASFNLAQAVQREATVLCRATVRIACVSASRFRPCALPESINLETLRGH